MTLFLSRLTLRRDPSTDALRTLLDPAEAGDALDAHHRLIWSAFADGPERRRDFLWRADGAGRFMTLSQRPPAAAPLFEPPEIKPFAPDLRPGDRLGFALRVNATMDRAKPERDAKGRSRNRRVDVVMHALHDLPKGEARRDRRMDVAQATAETWFARQGEANGFDPCALTVQDYSVAALPGHRGPRKGQPQFGILDLVGEVSLRDPEAFLARLASGFGRAKAFGCGLMLIRRI